MTAPAGHLAEDHRAPADESAKAIARPAMGHAHAQIGMVMEETTPRGYEAFIKYDRRL